ncbi:GAF domain-containing protein [Abditibacterium utsteinense]|uniref:histidine kinase n=1 Tax=Abditibacterium utsteinense TaxID=1960156 RepID=A0A2S8SVI2_9BACT|nr:GAF domain-containing protein [Abditibacterium utsteinense]PQV64807.1 GAF domain-containing protein [Abditibacterium utsteinense]
MNDSSNDFALSKGLATGSLADAALPGASFSPDDFDVELSQTSLAEADEILKATLEEAMHVVGGNRAFLALVDMVSGELALRFTAGQGWTDDIRRLRVNVQAQSNGGNSNSGSSRRGITRHVVVNGRAYWTGDVSGDPHYIGFFDDVKSEIAVPILTSDGAAIGVINIESTEPDVFGAAHAQWLEPLTRRAAIIVAMAEHQLREEALIAIGRDFNSMADLDALIHDVVEQATKILRADDCSLFLMDEAAESLELVASHGPLEAQAGNHTAKYRIGEGLTGWVAQNGGVIRVGDPRTDARWKGLFMEAPPGEIAAVMAVPVHTHRLKPGVLRVVRERKGSLYFLPQGFTQADEDVLVTLAGQLAVAIDRTRLTTRLLNAERMAAWGEMSARAAHMIGNTVFGVKGHLNEMNYILKSKDDADADWNDVKEMSSHITRGIYRLEGILGEFRDFVLATQLHTTTCDLNQILSNVTAETFPKHSDIDLVLKLTPGLQPILADEVKLKRAFSELIENSIDFQPQGGQVTVKSSLADPKSLSQITKTPFAGPVLRVDFLDKGPGLSELDRLRVFAPFYTKKAKGMGLGLSIVKGIIEAHGGSINEIGDEDQSDGGAHFVILLPAHQSDERKKSETRGEEISEHNETVRPPSQVFGGH